MESTHPPLLETPVRSLVPRDPTGQSNQACAPPALSARVTASEACTRAPTPCTEKPPRCEGRPPRESSLCSPQLGENPLSNGDPAKPRHLMKLSIFKNPLSSAMIKCNTLVVSFLNTTQNKDILGMKQLIS